MSYNYEYRVLYKPPTEEIVEEDPDTWRKVWYYSTIDCPEKLDLKIKLLELVRIYNLKERYITVQRLNDDKTDYEVYMTFDK